MNSATDPVVIGADVSGAFITARDYLEGAIDDLYVWNRPLSGSEIQEVFAL